MTGFDQGRKQGRPYRAGSQEEARRSARTLKGSSRGQRVVREAEGWLK